ncbi:MAG: PAS domain S-box protein [Chloroflexi bacterium]|nr:PAS domain S-box protein [Chloroflexota bacterium]
MVTQQDEGQNHSLKVAEELQRLRAKVAELEFSCQQTEEILYGQEQQLKALIENTPDIISRFNREFRYIYINPVVEQVTGLPPHFYIGKNHQEVGVPEDKAVLWQTAYQAVFETGQVIRIEYDFPSPTGLQYYQSYLIPEFGKDGTVEAVLNIARDVGLSKRVEEQFRRTTRALRVRSECTKLLVQSPSDTTEAALMQQICHQIAEVGGYSLVWAGFVEQDEARMVRPIAYAGLGSGYVKNLKISWSEDNEFGRGPAGTAIQIGKPVPFHNILTAPDFAPWREEAIKYGFKAVLALPLTSEGQAFGVLTFYADQIDSFDREETNLLEDLASDLAYRINSLRIQAERNRAAEEVNRWAHFFKHISLGVLIGKNESLTVEMVNPAFAAMHGYTVEELIGQPISSLLSPEALPDLLKSSVIAQQQHHYIHETTAIRKDGSLFPVLVDVTVVKELNGKSFYGITSVQDITERKQAEEALHKSQQQLLQSQKLESVGRLAGGIAHDFNNLLTTITGYSELILSSLDPEDFLWSDITEISKAAERAAALTRQLLAFSRQQVLQPKILNLNIVMAEMNKLLRRLIGEDVELITLHHPDLHLVRADPGQIEQVIMNLAVNARDAMPEGGKLTLETANVELSQEYVLSHYPNVKTGSYVMLTVSDTGFGMDADTQARIFEPFFTTKPIGKGTGLGLATVYGIIKQSGGYIWLYSELGVGTTFKIYLPQVVESAEDAPTSVVLDSASLRGSETILLVEDETEVRGLMHRVLGIYGYTVLEATHGYEALRLCEEYPNPIDLVITDLIMPQMGGQEMVEKLVELKPDLRVLYMSGYTDRVLGQQGLLGERKAFMQKPFTPLALAQKVREVLALA